MAEATTSQAHEAPIAPPHENRSTRPKKKNCIVSGSKFNLRRSPEKGAATMTMLTVQTNSMKRSYRNSLWTQLDAASCSLVSFASKSPAGFDRLGGPPPVPC